MPDIEKPAEPVKPIESSWDTAWKQTVAEVRTAQQAAKEESPAAPVSAPTNPAADSSAPAEKPTTQELENAQEQFSKIDPAKLSPDERRMFDTMQVEFTQRIAEAKQREEEAKDLLDHKDFHRTVKGDPRLQEHIRAYFEGRTPEPQKPAAKPKDQLETFFEKLPDGDRQIAEAIAKISARAAVQQVMQELQPQLSSLGDVKRMRDETVAAREENDFVSKYPDWKANVDARDLAEAKRLQPAMPLASLYKILAFDKATAEAARSARTSAVEKIVGRQAPNTESARRAPETQDKISNFNESFDHAFRTLRRAV